MTGFEVLSLIDFERIMREQLNRDIAVSLQRIEGKIVREWFEAKMRTQKRPNGEA